MAKRKFEMQWTDFAFIVESAGGLSCHTVRDKMVDARRAAPDRQWSF